MDIDVFAAQHAGQWRRLDALASQRRLSGREADELVHLYRQGATQLSVLRSTAPDPALVSQLSITLVKARGRIGSPHDASWRTVVRFVVRTVPAALYQVRWWAVATAAICLGVAVVVGVWASGHPVVLNQVMPPADQADYVKNAFAQYYQEYSHASFTAQVWTNNARVAALAVAGGITGIYPAYILFENSLNLGAAAAVMHVNGGDFVFWSLILPHGMLELSCVFFAGAAGVRLLWAWLVPGQRTRAASLAHEGRTTIVVVVALTAFLLLSGLLEGFVTPSGWPWWLKIGVGACACALLWVTTFWLGRRATRDGEDPGVSDEEASSEVPTAG